MERAQTVDAYRQGAVSPHVYERLIADVDAQLLRLESGEDLHHERRTAEHDSGSGPVAGSSPPRQNTSGEAAEAPQVSPPDADPSVDKD